MTLKWAILGFGIFGEKRLIPGFEGSKNSELYAISKRNEDEAKKKANEYGVIPYWGDEAINQIAENDEIDCVFIATPNFLHMDNMVHLAEAGKHIIVEKPMAMNAHQCNVMIKAAKVTGIKFSVGHHMRFNPVIKYIRKQIQDDVLGEIIYATIDYQFNASRSNRKWLWDPKIAGGGASFDIGVHAIDCIRCVLDAKPDEVSNIGAISRYRDMGQGEIDSSSSIHFNVRKTLARVNCSFEAAFKTWLEFHGTKGKIWAKNFTSINSMVELKQVEDGEDERPIKIRVGNMYADELTEFSKAVEEATEVPILPIEGLENQKIIDEVVKRT